MIPWLVGALGVAAVTILALVWRSQRDRARNEADLWRETAKRQVTDLTTAAANAKALEGACNVLRDELKAQSDYLASLVSAHPDLAGDYVVEQLRKAGRLVGAQPAPAQAGTSGADGDRRAGGH